MRFTIGTMGQFGAIQSVAPSFGVELNPINVRDPGEIERAITNFAAEPNGGLIVTASPLAAFHRGLIIALAARHRLPAVYIGRFFVTDGGLISYGPDLIDQPGWSAAKSRRGFPHFATLHAGYGSLPDIFKESSAGNNNKDFSSLA